MLTTQPPKRPRRGKRFSLKRLLPTSLFGRALLILLVPVVVLQLLVANVFYHRHWDSVVRNMSMTTAADVAMLTSEYQDLRYALGSREALQQTMRRGSQLGIDVRMSPPENRSYTRRRPP